MEVRLARSRLSTVMNVSRRPLGKVKVRQMKRFVIVLLLLLTLPSLAQDSQPVSADQLDGQALKLSVGKILPPSGSLWYLATQGEEGEAYIAFDQQNQVRKAMIVVLNRGLEEPTLNFAHGLVTAMSEGSEEGKFQENKFDIKASQYPLFGKTYQFTHSPQGNPFIGFVSISASHTMCVWNYGEISETRWVECAKSFSAGP